ncbi:MAG: DUF1385 domain-containing protein [Actinobacteria bacterium]|nr:DUF1385 domain-containing protein [Actinomycetota bacterium]
MIEEKIRLGGMALANGVLVHGPNAWACAVRTPDGTLRVESDVKRFRAARVQQPLLRGPARMLEAFALLPQVRRRVPEARLPFERPAVLAALAAGAVFTHFVRSSGRLGPAAKELIAGLASLGPAAVALRGSTLAAYHGAEHISIGTYEHGEPREKEHERCGSHLIGPLLATMAAGNALASKAPRHLRGPARAAASAGALAVSTETFSWMTKHPETRVAKLLAWPGHELQHRLATAEPTPDQLQVAEAALEACLRLERAADGARDQRA